MAYLHQVMEEPEHEYVRDIPLEQITERQHPQASFCRQAHTDVQQTRRFWWFHVGRRLASRFRYFVLGGSAWIVAPAEKQNKSQDERGDCADYERALPV